MGNLKLSLEDFIAYDFELIAIHTVIEETKLAFLLNKYLEVNFVKNQKSIQCQTKNGEAFFNWYVYDDEDKDMYWNLVVNKKNEIIQNTNNLFGEDSVVFTLIPELKNTDYILKIENVDEHINIDEIVLKINSLTKISTAYVVELDNIKSIKNLIF